MKHKNNITDENYEEVVLRRAINICWVLLAICFVVKIFGGNFFDIVCNNEKFVEFCNFADTNIFMKIIVGLFSSSLTFYFYLLAIAKKMKFSKKETIVVFSSIFICVILRVLSDYWTKTADNIVSVLLDVYQFFVLPFFISSKVLKERYIRRVIFAYILNFSFQLISMVTKSISLGFITSNFLIAVIFIIDVYIMLVLYYLYSNYMKEEKSMGIFLDWLFGKTDAQLRNMKATRLAKIEKLQEEVKAIDEEMNKKNESKD